MEGVLAEWRQEDPDPIAVVDKTIKPVGYAAWGG